VLEVVVDGEVQELLERVEIPVAMKERVPPLDAERCDEHVDGLAHGSTAAAQCSIVPGRLSGDGHARHIEDFEFPQCRLYGDGPSLVANTLQHLAHDDRRQPEALLVHVDFKPMRFWIVQAVEVVNPHGAVDDHHCRLLWDAIEPRCVQVTFPGHSASESTKTGLAAGLNQQSQCFFHNRALRLRAAASHRLPHQLVVDVDVRAHDRYV